MPGEVFEKIIDAEKRAKHIVHEAEEKSKRIIDEEKEHIDKERQAFYNKLEQKRKEKMREVENQVQLLREEYAAEIARKTDAAAQRYERMKNTAVRKVVEIMTE